MNFKPTVTATVRYVIILLPGLHSSSSPPLSFSHSPHYVLNHWDIKIPNSEGSSFGGCTVCFPPPPITLPPSQWSQVSEGDDQTTKLRQVSLIHTSVWNTTDGVYVLLQERAVFNDSDVGEEDEEEEEPSGMSAQVKSSHTYTLTHTHTHTHTWYKGHQSKATHTHTTLPLSLYMCRGRKCLSPVPGS